MIAPRRWPSGIYSERFDRMTVTACASAAYIGGTIKKSIDTILCHQL